MRSYFWESAVALAKKKHGGPWIQLSSYGAVKKQMVKRPPCRWMSVFLLVEFCGMVVV